MSEKIPVVEDNKQNRILLCDLFKYHGYDVLEAEDRAIGSGRLRIEPDRYGTTCRAY